MQEECRRWNAQTEATWVKEACKLLKLDFQGLRTELEEDPDGEALTMDEWKQLCVEMDRIEEFEDENDCENRSVETLTPESLPTDLSPYSSDGGHVVHVVPCAPTTPHVPKENRRPNGQRPSEMRQRKYVVDSDLRESADSRANPRDTLEDQRIRAKEQVAIHGTIELRNDDDSLELFDQRDESNQEIQAKFNVKTRW